MLAGNALDGVKMTLLDFSACHPHLAYQSIVSDVSTCETELGI
jgi:hypothetical protein